MPRSQIPRDQLLSCKIKNGVLTMSIGVDLIAHAARLHKSLQYYDERTCEYYEPRITDADKFAEEVRQRLLYESEDGTTLLHIALDQAILDAVENGGDGIDLAEDYLRKQRVR